MEWEVYYEDYLLFKKMSTYEDLTCQAAAIIGQDGKVWAQTSNFPQVKVEERNAILHEFDEPGMLTMMGLYLGGAKYVVIGVEPGDVIRAIERTDTSCDRWLLGVTIKKTSAALVIGIYLSFGASNMCNAIVERVGNDLIKRGYYASRDCIIPSYAESLLCLDASI